MDIDTKESKILSSLNAGETMTVELGPFVCETEKQVQKTYILCYRQGDNLIRFGHKFGFSVCGFKSIVKKIMSTSLREKIRELKMKSDSSKSEEYLRLKLKSMGVDVMSLSVDDETIIELIKQFK